MNQSHELFLLLLNLAQLSDRSQIVTTFIEAMADIFELVDVKFAAEADASDERVFTIRTLKRAHGYIVCSDDIATRSGIEQSLLRNAVSMLAVIIEKIEQDQLLSDEKLALNELVQSRSAELLEKNISLERLNTALEWEIAQRQAAERELEHFFQLSSGLLCIAGMDGYFKKLNPAWQHTLGWTDEKLMGAPWIDFVHPDDRILSMEAGEALIQGREIRGFENRYRTTNNDYRWLRWSSFPLLDEGIIFAVVLDVTETKQLEENLRQSEKMQAVGQLAGGIAHDFNNQLGGILGFADLLCEQLQRNSALRGYAENIVKAAKRSADLTRQLLTFARKGVYQAVPVNVHELLDDVMTLLHHTIDKQIQLVADYGNEEIIINGASSHLQNAVLNLALNARDALGEKGDGWIRFSTARVVVDGAFRAQNAIDVSDGAFVVISIEDNGTGMPPDVVSRALEPFFTTKEAGKGTGMGLSVVYGTVRHHQGDLSISSVPNQGTTIRIFLPIWGQPDERVDGSSHSAQTDYTETADSTKRLLLVDDEPMIQEMSAEMLKGLGYNVKVCKNGVEAVEYYKDNFASIDAVILDMIMPEMDGSKTFQRLKEINSDVRVILASGYSEDSLASKLITEGAAGFLQKPFRKRHLAKMVDDVLR